METAGEAVKERKRKNGDRVLVGSFLVFSLSWGITAIASH